MKLRGTFSPVIACCSLIVASATAHAEAPFAVVLGVAQDGGVPHAGCQRACCAAAFDDPARSRYVVSLGLVDPDDGQRWILECTPDFPRQLKTLQQLQPTTDRAALSGVLLTHAHIGHYSGLIHLGREVLGARDVPVYAMPRMRHYLETNGPWSQLVELRNIELRTLRAGVPTRLNDRLTATPLLVPHRDEFSETVGFVIEGPSRSLLFLPDIDKWSRWDDQIERWIESTDRAYLDGTFFAADELPNRDISEIPHPLIRESMERFETLPELLRNRVHFIHLNHTNPALDPDSGAAAAVRRAGHRIARRGERFEL